MSFNATFRHLISAAHVYFIALTLIWSLTSLFVGGYINYISLAMLAVFGFQAWYRHKVVNLVLGLIILPASIFWLLEFLNMGRHTGFDQFINIMVSLSVASLLFSIVLVFSYLKLSFTTQ